MATIDGLLTRADALLERVGRPDDYVRYAAEFDVLEARDAEGMAEVFVEELTRVLTAEYAHEEMKPGIVKLFEARPWQTVMQELQAQAEADRRVAKEQYISARMRGWKY